jgi:WD40 repeat protein
MQLVSELTGGKEAIHQVAFAAAGSQLAAVDRTGRILVWRAQGGTPVNPRPADLRLGPANQWMQCPRFTWQGRKHRIVPHEPDIRSAQLYDEERQREVGVFGPHQGTVLCLACWPPGGRLLSGAIDGQLRLWDLANRRLVAAFDHHRPVLCAELSKDGTQALSGAEDGVVRLFRLPS